ASCGPRSAGQPAVRDALASLPKMRPARAFGQQDRVGGAVTNVRQARHAIDLEDPLVKPRLVARAAWGTNHASVYQVGVDTQHAGIVAAGGRAVEACSRRRSNAGAPPFLNPVRLRRRALPDRQLPGYHLLVLRMIPGEL